ncbi:MAG TPA: DUF2024 family protein [Flavobacteriales bacterium]|nr:DUF2024 family protein [Flavobacteriales bacterium]
MFRTTLLALAFAFTGITACGQQPSNKKMEVAVWDTYVKKKDGSVMHFDIIAPSTLRDTTVIHAFGRAYLRTKGQEGQPLTAKECRFCHVRSVWPQWEQDIQEKGYFILEMEGCE